MVEWQIPFVVKRRVSQMKYTTSKELSKMSRNSRRRARDCVKSLRAQNQQVVSVLKDAILLSSVLSGRSKIPKPPYPHLLVSNDPPSEIEAEGIRRAVAISEKEIQQLNDVHQPNTELGLIVQQKLDYANRYVAQHKAVISAIRRLPVELLEEIFVFYHQVNSPQLGAFPLELGHVCRRWRTAALSIPRLWSRFPDLRLSYPWDESLTKFIAEMLLRSGDIPIEISFYIPYEKSNFSKPHPILTLFSQHSARWEAVFIDAERMSCTFPMLQHLRNHIPNLKRLTLCNWCPWVEDVSYSDIFANAPSLREVDLRGSYFGRIGLPFAQLSGYRDHMTGGSLVDQVVRTSTSLQRLDVGRDSFGLGAFITTLPSLVTLQIRVKNLSDQTILENLTLPLIEQIVISSFTGRLLPIISNLLRRSPTSSSTLKRLLIRSSHIDAGDLTDLLSLTPNLLELAVDIPPLKDVQALTVNHEVLNATAASKTFLAPSLQSLIFHVRSNTFRSPVMVSVIRSIARARCEASYSRWSSYDPPRDDTSHLGSDVQRLHTFRLIFNESGACRQSLPLLEGLNPRGTASSLSFLMDRLRGEVPNLAFGYVSKRDLHHARQRDALMKVLDDIAKLDLQNDAGAILLSGIHYCLRVLSQSTALPSRCQPIQKRAQGILDSWTPVFDCYMGRGRWVIKGSFSLTYLPRDDPLQTSLETFYGIPDDDLNLRLIWHIL